MLFRFKQLPKRLIGTAIDYVYSRSELKAAARLAKRLTPEFVRRRISRFSQGRRHAVLQQRRRARALLQHGREVPERAAWILRALDRAASDRHIDVI